MPEKDSPNRFQDPEELVGATGKARATSLADAVAEKKAELDRALEGRKIADAHVARIRAEIREARKALRGPSKKKKGAGAGKMPRAPKTPRRPRITLGPEPRAD